MTEIEDGHLAVCGNQKNINIFPQRIYLEDEEIINYIIYPKRKHLISAADEDIKVFNINLQNKSYNLLQVLNYHKNLTLQLLELSNGKLASSAYDSAIIIYNFKENKYEKEFWINVGTMGNECIIETTNKEICGSSTYDYIIEHGFSLINVFSHQVVQTFSNKEKLRMSYILYLSDGSNLIA